MHQEVAREKRDLILAAARKRFAYYGFSKVTMDEIAGDVGLAKPSLYYYYATKENLFRAVVAHEQEQFLNDIRKLLSGIHPAVQLLRQYVDVRFRLFRELVNLNALSFKSWAEIKSISGDLFRTFDKEELKTIEQILERGKSSGEFSPTAPQQTALLLLHLLHGLRLRVFQEEEGMPLSEEAYAELKRESELLVDIFVQALQEHH